MSASRVLVILAAVLVASSAMAETGSESNGLHDDGSAAEIDDREDPKIEDALRSTALLFFQALAAGVPEAIVEVSSFPFNLDGTNVTSRVELTRRLREALRRGELTRVPFYGVRLMPAEVMREQHGPPPERLGELDLEDAWVAVGNLGGHGFVAVFRKHDGVWRAFAYSE